MMDAVTHLSTLDTYPPFSVDVLRSEGIKPSRVDAVLALLPQALLTLSDTLKQCDGFSDKKTLLDTSQWQIDVTLTSDTNMRALNKAHREKDTSTDVLSFPMVHNFAEQFSEGSLPPHMMTAPINLGSIVISLDWADAHWTDEKERHQCLESYLLERVCHGCLHVMGLHHDTIEDYNNVVAIQTAVINAIFKA